MSHQQSYLQERPAPRAPDTICCKSCGKKHQMFIDRERHLKTFFQSWMFEFYECRSCDVRFATLGLPLVTIGAFSFGFILLLAIQMLRIPVWT